MILLLYIHSIAEPFPYMCRSTRSVKYDGFCVLSPFLSRKRCDLQPPEASKQAYGRTKIEKMTQVRRNKNGTISFYVGHFLLYAITWLFLLLLPPSFGSFYPLNEGDTIRQQN